MANKPTLVFAHANGLPGGSYESFLAPFKENFNVEIIDLLGHDPKFPVNNGWSNIVDELERKYAALPKPVIGMGHSLGAVATFGVARRQPEWFQALVMLDPPLVNGLMAVPFRLGMALGMSDKLTPAGMSKYRRDHWQNWDEVESYFSSKKFFQRFDPRCLEDYLRAGIVADDKGGYTLRFLRDVEVQVFRTGPPATLGKPKLQVPGVLVSGEQSDPMFHKAAAKHAKHHKMQHLFSSGTHMFPLEKPTEAYQTIVSWLSDNKIINP